MTTKPIATAKTAALMSAGCPEPSDPAAKVTALGTGVFVCRESSEIGLALSPSFRARHRLDWDNLFRGRSMPIASLSDADREVIRWFTLTELPSLAGLSAKTLATRIKSFHSAAGLIQPEGADRLGEARANGLHWNGRTLTIYAWAYELGIHPQTLISRLRNTSVPMDEVMNPASRKVKHLPRDVRDELQRNGVPYQTFYSRLRAGKTGEELTAPSRSPREPRFGMRESAYAELAGLEDDIEGVQPAGLSRAGDGSGARN